MKYGQNDENRPNLGPSSVTEMLPKRPDEVAAAFWEIVSNEVACLNEMCPGELGTLVGNGSGEPAGLFIDSDFPDATA